MNGSISSNIVSVEAGATLGGAGVIHGSTTIQSGATFAPGASPSTLTIDNSLTLNPGSTTLFHISKSPRTNDAVIVTSAVMFGGTLSVTNLAGNLAAGDNFKLFNAGSFRGSFSSQTLPELGTDLAWNTSRLGIDGTLWVMSTKEPTFTGVTLAATNLALSGSGGTPTWSYSLCSSTNVALPLSRWTPILTNYFDLQGRFVITIPVRMNEGGQFYQIAVPWSF